MAQFTPASNLTCPLDQHALTLQERSLKCSAGHSFDIAKQGYVNLLPVQKKNSKDPGDSKEMIQARQRFLQSGLYQPISDQLNQRVAAHLPTEPSAEQRQNGISILDAGCGEGYYLSRLAAENQRFTDTDAIELIGVDISKWGVQAATKYPHPITWLVGTNAQLPVEDHSVDLIICMFGFYQLEWFARALKPGGKVILAEAGPEHLIELREIIYPEVRRRDVPALNDAEAHGFQQLEQSQINFKPQTLNQAQIQDLLVMTPHLYRASYEGKQAAQALTELELSAEVVFRVLQWSA